MLKAFVDVVRHTEAMPEITNGKVRSIILLFKAYLHLPLDHTVRALLPFDTTAVGRKKLSGRPCTRLRDVIKEDLQMLDITLEDAEGLLGMESTRGDWLALHMTPLGPLTWNDPTLSSKEHETELSQAKPKIYLISIYLMQ